jgi:hypothetical protein
MAAETAIAAAPKDRTKSVAILSSSRSLPCAMPGTRSYFFKARGCAAENFRHECAIDETSLCLYRARPYRAHFAYEFFQQQRLGNCPTQEAAARRYRSAFAGMTFVERRIALNRAGKSKAPGNAGRQTLELK